MNESIEIPDEIIATKIYVLRGYKVMLDRDLAELYEVETQKDFHQTSCFSLITKNLTT